jgi:glycogen phosphorylase
MNDTHPSLAVAELMRVLLDEDPAVGRSLGDHAADPGLYQSHPAAGSAGEMVSAAAGKVLPRHMQIIFGINHEFLRQMTAVLLSR